MTAIWQQDEGGWRMLSPSGFPDEKTLHTLVEEAPHTLPLAGEPRLTILGREVFLGGNAADLVAVEQSGRLAIIEIKLARNAEARRAVIAQILTYAAYLRGLDVATLEREILGRALQKRGIESIAQAVVADDQQEAFDPAAFAGELADSLAQGRFRLVLVLDDAPPELVRLVGYLGAVADKLLIDLVTVSAYQIGGSQVVVPQRIDPEQPATRPDRVLPPPTDGRLVAGASDFEAAIERAPEDQRLFLRRVTEWAKGLHQEGLITLETYHGKSGLLTLLPRLRAYGSGLVTVFNEFRSNGSYLQLNPSVIAKRAPRTLDHIYEAAAAYRAGPKGTIMREVSDELLAALANGYREAASGRVRVDGLDRVDEDVRR